MNPLLIVMIVVGLLSLATGALLTFLATKLYRLRKTMVIWLEPNTRTLSISYEKVRGGKVFRKNKTYLVEGQALHSGMHRSVMIDPNTGWNFAGPTRLETLDSNLKYAVLEPSNPASYHRALHRNRWGDVLRAGEDKDRYAWVPMVAVIGLAALLAILGALVWMGTKITGVGT